MLALEKLLQYILQCLNPPWQNPFLPEEFKLLIKLFRHPVTTNLFSQSEAAEQSAEGLDVVGYVLDLLSSKWPRLLTFYILHIVGFLQPYP